MERRAAASHVLPKAACRMTPADIAQGSQRSDPLSSDRQPAGNQLRPSLCSFKPSTTVSLTGVARPCFRPSSATRPHSHGNSNRIPRSRSSRIEPCIPSGRNGDQRHPALMADRHRLRHERHKEAGVHRVAAPGCAGIGVGPHCARRLRHRGWAGVPAHLFGLGCRK